MITNCDKKYISNRVLGKRPNNKRDLTANSGVKFVVGPPKEVLQNSKKLSSLNEKIKVERILCTCDVPSTKEYKRHSKT